MSPSITSTLAFHSCITLSPNIRSKGNEKYKEEEEEKLHYTTLNYKMKMRTTLNLAYLPLWNPRGVFIGTREEERQGTNPGPKRGARRGHVAVARAALRAARSPFCLLSVSGPGFVI